MSSASFWFDDFSKIYFMHTYNERAYRVPKKKKESMEKFHSSRSNFLMKINYYCLWVSVKKKRTMVCWIMCVFAHARTHVFVCVWKSFISEGHFTQIKAIIVAMMTITMTTVSSGLWRCNMCWCAVMLTRAYSHNNIQLKCYCSQWTIKNL